METWQVIDGWPEYEVSDFGRVRSLPRKVGMVDGRTYSVAGGIRSLWTDPKGYVHATLYRRDRGTRKAVHRLVAEAFVGEIPEGMIVCHNDGNPSNNRATNLRIDTNSGNQLDRQRHGTASRGEANPRARLTSSEIREIRRMYESGQANQTQLAAMFDTPQTNVSNIVRRKAWAHVT